MLHKDDNKEGQNFSVYEVNKPFYCGICDYSSFNKASVKKHTAMLHKEKKAVIKCDLCSYTTLKTFNLERHVSTVHDGIKPEIALKMET